MVMCSQMQTIYMLANRDIEKCVADVISLKLEKKKKEKKGNPEKM